MKTRFMIALWGSTVLCGLLWLASDMYGMVYLHHISLATLFLLLPQAYLIHVSLRFLREELAHTVADSAPSPHTALSHLPSSTTAGSPASA